MKYFYKNFEKSNYRVKLKFRAWSHISSFIKFCRTWPYHSHSLENSEAPGWYATARFRKTRAKPLPESGMYLLEFAAAVTPCVANHCMISTNTCRLDTNNIYQQKKYFSTLDIYANKAEIMRQEERNYITIRSYR